MRYGCVRDSHRLNVGEPVGIRQSRKNLLAKRSVIAKTIRYLDMFSGMGGFREGLTRAGDVYKRQVVERYGVWSLP